MGLTTSFQIGRSALAAYQSAISVVGQNIANVSNPDYTRQTAHLEAIPGQTNPQSAGLGVNMDALQRHMDAALEDRLRGAQSQLGTADMQYFYLSQIESLYQELTDTDLSSQLNELFGAFGALQSDPEDIGTRNLVVAAADTVLSTLKRQNSGLTEQMMQMNNAAETLVREASSIANEVASLNQTIAVQESDGQTVASALRDRRDGLLRDLSEMMDITVRYQDNGSANVYVNSEPLVEFGRARGLTAERTWEDGIETVKVRYADNNGTVVVNGGKLGGLLAARDGTLADQLGKLDEIAKALIYEVNALHSQGKGLVGREQVLSAYAATDPAAALDSAAADLPFPVENGTFLVNLRDTITGQVITRQIEVDLDGIGADTTLNDLAAALDGVPGLTAGVSPDNRLEVQTDANTEMWFSDDSSGALAALGMNVFFTGTSIQTAEVSAAIRSDVRLIAASTNGQAGDGGNAGRIARLADAPSALLGGSQSIGDFHTTMIETLGVSAAAARTNFQASDAVFQSLSAQREAISGVSLDEEALKLTMYERSFQGASRFLTVVQGLTSELMSLVR